MTEALKELGEYISHALPNEVLSTEVTPLGELNVVAHAPSIVKVLTFLRDDASCLFKQLVDLCGVDWPAREQRFDVVYHLLSLKQNQRVRVKIATDEETPVPSVVEVFSAANWFEREVWDMFGVVFAGHPDLRRILTDYGFEGHPLRKDFPLGGYVEIRYDDTLKRCVYQPIDMVQDYRRFDTLSPWGGQQERLGDEKAEGSRCDG